ncbi:cuticle protein CP14.6-like [Pollicipes pollicipes]|uniref:cuticle protein CP14.6-like n=1 Tax=Pollicipes pollicipes TaxID=41117 RepID=UPI001885377C|nr:cuticle protein CP14.6-like [Pollicipes pollicipes]
MLMAPLRIVSIGLCLVAVTLAAPRLVKRSPQSQNELPASSSSDKSERDARIVTYTSENFQDGYRFEFDTTNGISREEVGKVFNGPSNNTGVMTTEGRVQWNTPEGTRIEILFHADENGYQPRGVHLVSTHWHPVAELPDAITDYKLLQSVQQEHDEKGDIISEELIPSAIIPGSTF